MPFHDNCMEQKGRQWDFLAQIFARKGFSFESLINRFVRTVSGITFEEAVEEVCGRFSMELLMKDSTLFIQFSNARYATDVLLKQTCILSSSMHEGKVYCSGKHKFVRI